MIDSEKLLNLYSALFDQELEAIEIKKDISDQLKSYAENIEISPKAIKTGYNLYKKYKDGKNTMNELDDVTEIENMIASYFVSSDLEEDK